eukprot:COSAG02_NODE_5177_length_4568_cov_4.409488_3_plen_117_part_00
MSHVASRTSWFVVNYQLNSWQIITLHTYRLENSDFTCNTRTCDIRNDRECSLAIEFAVIEGPGSRNSPKSNIEGDVLLRPTGGCNSSIMSIAWCSLPRIMRPLFQKNSNLKYSAFW